MTMYRVIIIGAGRIAAGYDSPTSQAVLTHCHALYKNSNFELIGLYDENLMTAEAACHKWHTKVIKSLEDCKNNNPDIVVICTPDHTHYNILTEVLQWHPRLVISEKPLTNSLKASEDIVNKYELYQIPLAVVYQRRFDVDINYLHDMIKAGIFGKYLAGTLIYSKGLFHNGSHGIDLLIYLFGSVLSSEYHSHRNDFYDNDPTISARLSFEAGDLYLIAGDERFHSLFELDLIFEKQRIRLLDSGLTIEVHNIVPDPVFSGYSALMCNLRRPSSLNQSLVQMWGQIGISLNENIPLPTQAREALEVQRICSELVRKAIGY